MAKYEPWPRTEKPLAGKPSKYCCNCHREIKPGQKYHYLQRRGRQYFHADCYEKELKT